MAFRLGIYIFKVLLANEPHMDKTPTLAEKGRQARRRNVRNQHPGPRSYITRGSFPPFPHTASCAAPATGLAAQFRPAAALSLPVAGYFFEVEP